MVLIGPVFLWALVRTDPKALRTPWPYVGGLVALLVFSPAPPVERAERLGDHALPARPRLRQRDRSPVANALPEAVPSAPRVADDGPDPGERAASVLGYLGTQTALWGLLAIPAVMALVRRRTSPEGGTAGRSGPGPKGHSPALGRGPVPAALLRLDREPGVPRAELAGHVPDECRPPGGPDLGRVAAWVWAAAAGNALLITLYAWHAATAVLPLGDAADRILRETHGYRELAARAAALDGLVFADGYQTAAMLRFYQPGLAATQWPGVTRPSEYLRGVIAPAVGLDQVRRAGGFWLVGRRSEPPQIPGFIAQAPRVLIDCKGAGLARSRPARRQEAQPPCPRPLHRWQLVRYAASGEP